MWPGLRSESTKSTDPRDGDAECAAVLDALEGARVLFMTGGRQRRRSGRLKQGQRWVRREVVRRLCAKIRAAQKRMNRDLEANAGRQLEVF
jgi:hypothetical protein